SCRRSTFDFDFDGSGQAVLKRNARTSIGVHRKFHTDGSVAYLACDNGYPGGDNSILGPRKSLEPNPGTLSRMNMPQRLGGIELSQAANDAKRDPGGQPISLRNDAADTKVSHLCESAGHRGPDLLPFNLVLQPADRSRRGLHVPV